LLIRACFKNASSEPTCRPSAAKAAALPTSDGTAEAVPFPNLFLKYALVILRFEGRFRRIGSLGALAFLRILASRSGDQLRKNQCCDKQ
jgi:hypothetical protein